MECLLWKHTFQTNPNNVLILTFYSFFFIYLGTWNIRGEDETTSVAARLTNEEREDVLNMKKHPDLYNRMITSLAPTVWGHDDVKKGILLQLFGGVHKTTPEGMRLRGKQLNTLHNTEIKNYVNYR